MKTLFLMILHEEICSRQAVRRKRYGQYTDIDKKAARNC